MTESSTTEAKLKLKRAEAGVIFWKRMLIGRFVFETIAVLAFTYLTR